ncbi:hypothetical protein C8J57DRAFT_1247874 [Mycena rebaudengoi]|nr:hypothetical protein C8J57DRAFT_1247874 [Mycena rebaudengoi]
MKYLAALSILLIASFTVVCVAQVNPAFAGFTSNATMTVVNYPKLNAVGGLPPSSGTISGSVYDRGSCKGIETRQKGDFIRPNGTTGSITFGDYAFSGTTSVNFAQTGILDGTLFRKAARVLLSTPGKTLVTITCGFLCFSYTYYFNNVTCPGTASTTGSKTTTTPTSSTGSKTSTTTTSTFATKLRLAPRCPIPSTHGDSGNEERDAPSYKPDRNRPDHIYYAGGNDADGVYRLVGGTVFTPLGGVSACQCCGYTPDDLLR